MTRVPGRIPGGHRRTPRLRPRFDDLEGRVVPSLALAEAVHRVPLVTMEILNQAGRCSRSHSASYTINVESTTTITVDVSPLPHRDTVSLIKAGSSQTFNRQAGGAGFSSMLAPGTYTVLVGGPKKARFQISIYDTPPAPSASSLYGTYVGTATTRITQMNPITLQDISSAVESYQQTETMLIGPPAMDPDGLRENNPFNLNVSPTSSRTVAGGNLNLSSGADFATIFGTLLERYWALELTASGFAGTLVASASSSGASFNGVIGLAYVVPLQPQLGVELNQYTFKVAQDGAPFATTMTATFLNSNTLSIQIHGFAIGAGSDADISINYVATKVS